MTDMLVSRCPQTGSPLGKLWRKVRNGISESITLYQGTRHSIASQLANNGASLNIISELLGHSDMRMTRRYSHIGITTLRNVMQQAKGTQKDTLLWVRKTVKLLK